MRISQVIVGARLMLLVLASCSYLGSPRACTGATGRWLVKVHDEDEALIVTPVILRRLKRKSLVQLALLSLGAE